MTEAAKLETVSAVIPGRNCARTIGPCLEALVPLLEGAASRLGEIIFVDDGSTDDTRSIVESFPVRLIAGEGKGPGSARNLGWASAEHPLIWFVDSDCVADGDALSPLLDHIDAGAGAVSGSYGNMNEHSLLACLIHEEIIERHLGMPEQVDFLATFNVIYRRSVLDEIGGFDERFLKGQDAELSFRALAAGHELHFDIRSRVKHFHETRWGGYLRTQRQQGYWRVWLYLIGGGQAGGDSYSNVIDHVQPPLAVLSLGSLPLVLLPYGYWVPGVCVVLLLLAQVPLTLKIVRRVKKPSLFAFGLMSVIRAYWRGIGLAQGTIGFLLRDRSEDRDADDQKE